MVDVSAAYAAATVRSHRMVAKVEVRTPNDSALLATLRFTGGTVSSNYRNVVRRTISLSVPDPNDTLRPRGAGDLLDPLSGNELWAYRGIRLSGSSTPDGTEQWCGLGVFPITDAPSSRGPNGRTLELKGVDRSERIAPILFTRPFAYPGGSLNVAVDAILRDRWPDVPLDLGDQDEVINSGVILDGADGWAAAHKLCLDSGYLLAFDIDGVCRKHVIVDPSLPSPRFTYGPQGARVLTGMDRNRTRDNVKTGVVIRVQNADNTGVFVGEAWDLNPESATYSDGPLGRRPEFFDAPSISSNGSADIAADRRLRLLSGRAEPVKLRMVPNAALEVGDVIAAPVVEDADATNVFVDDMEMPLVPGQEASATCRTTIPLDPAA